jgi:predicted nucleic acid-binding protein
VLDASVLSKWYLRDEDLLNEADHFRMLAESGDALVVAPHLSRHEVANSFATACRDGRVTWDIASNNLAGYIASEVSLDSDPDWLIARAAEHAINFSVAIYDTVYAGLAERLGGQLMTADEKFYNRVSRGLPFVQFLGHFRV